MHVSVFDLFKIGIGPSSSHTMGPMTASCRFIREVEERGQLAKVARVTVDLYGSLALTGKGHATDTAVTLGLAGWLPAQVDPDAAAKLIEEVRANGKLALAGSQSVDFRIDRDIHWHYKESLPYHPNALTLHAYDAQDGVVHEGTFYSVGGGFVVTQAEAQSPTALAAGPAIPFPFDNAEELLVMAEREKVRIADIMMRNECVVRSEQEVRDGLDRIWSAMSACIDRGMRQEGILPGGLNVKRRAAKLREMLEKRERDKTADALIAMDWINAWALAVNEENAAGGKVVTAPTNGAAGLVPAVLRYYDRYCRRHRRRPAYISADSRRDRLAVQAQRQHFRRRSRLPGRDRRRVLDGCGRARGGAGRHATNRSRMPRKSAWSTTSVSRAIRFAGWCRSRASSATRPAR